MAGSRTKFEQYIDAEVQKYRGIAYPIKSSLLRRRVVRHAPCQKLHPNPGDEFCDPDIGPNGEIIQSYCQEIDVARRYAKRDVFSQPLMVERIHPDGYQLLNGHHRWAAAMNRSVRKVPIKIVNPTLESDLMQMIRKVHHHKRVTLDLDEVIFSGGAENAWEGPPAFPWNLLDKQQLRRGVPALIYYFRSHQYDVWVYSRQYHSFDAIRALFRHYHVQVDGIVTGMVAKRPEMGAIRERLEKLTKDQYPKTVHIDARSVLCIDREARAFQEFELTGNAETWSHEIMDCMGAYEKQ